MLVNWRTIESIFSGGMSLDAGWCAHIWIESCRPQKTPNNFAVVCPNNFARGRPKKICQNNFAPSLEKREKRCIFLGETGGGKRKIIRNASIVCFLINRSMKNMLQWLMKTEFDSKLLFGKVINRSIIGFGHSPNNFARLCNGSLEVGTNQAKFKQLKLINGAHFPGLGVVESMDCFENHSRWQCNVRRCRTARWHHCWWRDKTLFEDGHIGQKWSAPGQGGAVLEPETDSGVFLNIKNMHSEKSTWSIQRNQTSFHHLNNSNSNFGCGSCSIKAIKKSGFQNLKFCAKVSIRKLWKMKSVNLNQVRLPISSALICNCWVNLCALWTFSLKPIAPEYFDSSCPFNPPHEPTEHKKRQIKTKKTQPCQKINYAPTFRSHSNHTPLGPENR